MSDLKPCPFCGDMPPTPVDATKILGVWRFTHKCKVLGPVSIESATPESLANKWNTRTDTTLDTAMKLLRDNQSTMHFDRELNQADHDVLREARKWR